MAPDHSLVLPTFAQPLELHTKRCVLRQWKDSDLPAWAAMNADAEVRRYFPSVASVEQALGEAQRCRDAIAQRGWGMWALEVPGVMPFAGFVGLNAPHYDAPWIPAVEIGWRLTRAAWGQGLATEAAQAALGGHDNEQMHLILAGADQQWGGALPAGDTYIDVGQHARHALGIAVLAASADLRATGHRVPRRFGPFYGGIGTHT